MPYKPYKIERMKQGLMWHQPVKKTLTVTAESSELLRSVTSVSGDDGILWGVSEKLEKGTAYIHSKQ